MKINLLLALLLAMPWQVFSQDCVPGIDVVNGTVNYSTLAPTYPTCDGNVGNLTLGIIVGTDVLVFDEDLIVNGDMLLQFGANGGTVVINDDVTVTVLGKLEFTGTSSGAILTVNGELIVEGNFIAMNNKTYNGDGYIRIDGTWSGHNPQSDCPDTCQLEFTVNECIGQGGGNIPPICQDAIDNFVPLPITLLNFGAKPTGNAIQIFWSTASETSNDFFTIERSADGLNWEVLRNVDGAGNSTAIKSYATFDNQPFPLNTYYRLKQTDYDGTFTYSPAVDVLTGEQATLETFPNPAINHLSIKAGFALDGSFVQLLDLQGKVYWEKAFPKNSGWKVDTDISQLHNGLYMLNCMTQKGNIISKKVLVQH